MYALNNVAFYLPYDKCLYHHSKWNLTASNFLMAAWLKLHRFRPVSFTMPYSKLNIMTELSANDVKFMSIDRQKIDLSIYMYLWYRKFYICRDTNNMKMTLVELYHTRYMISEGLSHVFCSTFCFLSLT